MEGSKGIGKQDNRWLEATMNIVRFLSTGTAILIVCGCGESRYPFDPTVPSFTVQSGAAELRASARQIQTSGQFDAIVDFSTVTLTPRGRNCLLQVDGRLVFTGTIEGTATAHTSALEFAPCSEVPTVPPGTFADVFKSEAVFVGTVDGEPARANLLYMGRVAPGGTIAGRFVFSNGIEGRLDVTARVAVGGTYQGSVVVR